MFASPYMEMNFLRPFRRCWVKNDRGSEPPLNDNYRLICRKDIIQTSTKKHTCNV
jgi:hypothetical protein